MAVSLKKVEKWAQKKKVNKLVKALSVNDLEVRTAIIRALGETKDENAMNTLIPLLKDPDVSIRGAAVDALGTMGSSRSLEFIRQLWAGEGDEEVREKARLVIAAIKGKMSREERF